MGQCSLQTQVKVSYTHFNDSKIREKVVATRPITTLPAGMSNQYIEHLHAIYSVAIKLDVVRTTLQNFGVAM